MMRLLLFVGLVLVGVANPSIQTTTAKERKITIVGEEANRLKVSIVLPKRKFRRTEQFKLLVMITNVGKKDVYVLGTLEWGYSASLLFHAHNSSGKQIMPFGIPDDITRVSKDDKSAFVRLLPSHFLGTDFFAPLDVLNLNKPGRYAIHVEYTSLFTTGEVDLKPFFAKEAGPLRSNVVWIEVVP
jgi:hypothetical protein